MGYGIKQLKSTFSVGDMLSGGIDLKSIQRDAATKSEGAITPSELKEAGVSIAELKEAGQFIIFIHSFLCFLSTELSFDSFK